MECVHHWLIAPPEGPTSEGVCRKCGERREFSNHVKASAWGWESRRESDEEEVE